MSCLLVPGGWGYAFSQVIWVVLAFHSSTAESYSIYEADELPTVQTRQLVIPLTQDEAEKSH